MLMQMAHTEVPGHQRLHPPVLTGPAHPFNPRTATHHPCHGAWKNIHLRQHQCVLGQAVGPGILLIVEHMKCPQDGSQASSRYQHCGQIPSGTWAPDQGHSKCSVKHPSLLLGVRLWTRAGVRLQLDQRRLSQMSQAGRAGPQLPLI